MINIDEDALMCDLAETYHIYDYRSLPLKTVAAFSVGLRGNSRIKLKLADADYPLETMILASIFDNLNARTWAMSKEGAKPRSLANSLMGKNEPDNTDEMVFDSVEAFEAARQKFLKGGE